MSKPALLLLHGALGAHEQFDRLRAALDEDFITHAFSFSGHGARGLDGKTFSMQTFADDIAAYLDDHALADAMIFGYSMGGYAAVELALQQPGRIAAVMTLGTKFEWSPEIAEREVRGLDPEKIAAKVPKFAAQLETRHTAMGWQNHLRATAAMMHELGEKHAANNGVTVERVAELTARSRFARGDGDKMVSMEETLAIFQAVPQAQLEIMPGTPHPLELVDTACLAFSIREFFGSN